MFGVVGRALCGDLFFGSLELHTAHFEHLCYAGALFPAHVVGMKVAFVFALTFSGTLI